MPKKIQTIRKKYKRNAKREQVLRVVGICLFFILFLLMGVYINEFIQVRMASVPREVIIKPEIKNLPPEMKKKLRDHPPKDNLAIPILMYHYIEYVKDKKDTMRQSLDVTPFIFETQLQTLQQAGYTFMTMEEVGNVLDGKQDLPDKPIVMTFDDGYRDFYTDAYPLVSKYKVKATVYVVPGFINGSNYLTSSQLVEIAANPSIEIAAHTVHHVWLKNMHVAQATKEITESKEDLEKMTGRKIVSFAYPYGAFDDQALSLVKNAGFITAVSTIPGMEVNQANRYFIFRLRPGGRTGEGLLHFIETTKFKPY